MLLLTASTALASPPTLSPAESALLSDVNQTRVAYGLRPVSIGPDARSCSALAL